MARIADQELKRLKEEISVERLVEGAGIEDQIAAGAVISGA